MTRTIDESNIRHSEVPCIFRKTLDPKEDIQSIEIGFNNSESLFIGKPFILDYYFEFHDMVDVVDDPIFTMAFKFCDAHLILDLSYLQEIYGDKVLEQLLLKGGIYNIRIETNDDYPLQLDNGMLLFLPKDCKEEALLEDDSIVISWKHCEVC